MLRAVELNFGKELDVSSKILKGSCTVVFATELFLLEEDAISVSCSSFLTIGTCADGIAGSLFPNNFFAIVYFECKAPLTSIIGRCRC